MTRRVLLITHPMRTDLHPHARDLVALLSAAGIESCLRADQIEFHQLAGTTVQAADPLDPAHGAEMVIVLGGDGTILRGAEISREAGVPLLGINFGHVGFLAEAERDDLAAVVESIAARNYTIEERMTVEVVARLDEQVIARSWALNEVTVEKASRERMLELLVEVGSRPLSTFGCDGVIVATPTGSTAYAFSAGGPVVWPDVPALLIVPISAHALFARPLVVGPDTTVAIELIPGGGGKGVLWCDGARPCELPAATRVEVSHGQAPVHLVRMAGRTFTDRLVEKFGLSVQGWRGGDPSSVTPLLDGPSVFAGPATEQR